MIQDSLRLFMSSQTWKFPFLAPITFAAVCLHTSHGIIWFRKPERLGGGRGGREWQLTHLRMQSAAPLFSVFTTHPHTDTTGGQELEQAMTAASAGTTTTPGNHSLRVTASWQACMGRGTDESSRVSFQNTFKPTLPRKAAVPRLFHLAVHSSLQVTFPLSLA